jgi:hypothetical protein
MTFLDDIIGSGEITLIILAILSAEALLYLLFFKRLRKMLATLGAGACLVLALRAALIGQGSSVVASFLSVGFIFHVVEIWQWLKMSKSPRT